MFNFKSAGIKIDDPKFRPTITSEKNDGTPISIKTPLQSGLGNTELYAMHYDPLKALADNLKNLLQTNKGERLGRYEIGCSLQDVLFDRANSKNGEYEQIAMQSIMDQVQKFLPVINIDNIDFSPIQTLDTSDRSSLSKIVVKLTFSVPKLRRSNNKIEVVLYNGG